jgi:hypothetical protein
VPSPGEHSFCCVSRLSLREVELWYFMREVGVLLSRGSRRVVIVLFRDDRSGGPGVLRGCELADAYGLLGPGPGWDSEVGLAPRGKLKYESENPGSCCLISGGGQRGRAPVPTLGKAEAPNTLLPTRSGWG